MYICCACLLSPLHGNLCVLPDEKILDCLLSALCLVVKTSLVGTPWGGGWGVGLTKEIDKGIKNPWWWDWVESKSGGFFLSEFIWKLNKPGKALCLWCDAEINYASRGEKGLVTHVKSYKHRSQIKIRKTNYLNSTILTLHVWRMDFALRACYRLYMLYVCSPPMTDKFQTSFFQNLIPALSSYNQQRFLDNSLLSYFLGVIINSVQSFKKELK